jgi:hypothetical protein
MKRIILIFFVLISFEAWSQPWPGYNTSIYSGIHTLSYQPEIHSVMPSDWDINVLSMNFTFFNENFFGIDPLKELQDDISDFSDVTNNRTGLVDATIQFPSLAYRINEKSTLGFSWRLRALLFSNISNGELSNFINDINSPADSPVAFANDFATGLLTSFSSYTLFYSREIFEINNHKLLAGINLNVLSGTGSAYLDLTNVNFSYSNGVLSDVDLTFRMAISQEVDKLVNEDEFPLFNTLGFGSDFGITYMNLKENNQDFPYSYKLGFSVIGLGKINYNASLANSINIKIDEISVESFSGIESFSQLKDTLLSVFAVEEASTDKITTKLPLDINLYGDFHVYNQFYLHVAYTRQIIYYGKDKYEDLCYNQYYIVPRYETKKIGVYLPFTYNKFLNLETGIAFRWKPLVIGSGNLLSYFFKGENNTNLDVYITSRIMINKKKK